MATPTVKNVPNFVNSLTNLCDLCDGPLIRCWQTRCGHRICDICINFQLKDKDLIDCPFVHDTDEAAIECQGISKEYLIPDRSARRDLDNQMCECPHSKCQAQITYKDLQQHIQECKYVPIPCANTGCNVMIQYETEHVCDYRQVQCTFCSQTIIHKLMDKHIDKCKKATFVCNTCDKTFVSRIATNVHKKVNADCIDEAGKCWWYSYCNFETDDLAEIKKHMAENQGMHLEAVAVNVKRHDHSQLLEKIRALETLCVQNKLDIVNGKEPPVMPPPPGTCTNQNIVESHSQNIRRHNYQMMDIEKDLKNVSAASFDGEIIWKITDYKQRKSNAIRGRQMSIYSSPFYTSKYGYKMCLRVYLNGDGLGKGESLSTFLVIMKGDYDELLEFPFTHKVTFTLLAPNNPSLNKSETFLPDPESSSFRRPQTTMNIASGCPQFALQSEVESSTYLVHDTIYIKTTVVENPAVRSGAGAKR